MSFAVVRLYQGTSPLNNAQLDHMAGLELVPQLAALSGFIRYSMIALDDGRKGSVSVYSNSDRANVARELTEDWMARCIAVENLRLDEIMQGPLAYSFEGDAKQIGESKGHISVYQSDASLFDINEALLSEAYDILRTTNGIIRYSVMKLRDNRVLELVLTDTNESSNRVAAIAALLRERRGSRLGQIFPEAPETIDLTGYAGPREYPNTSQ